MTSSILHQVEKPKKVDDSIILEIKKIFEKYDIDNLNIIDQIGREMMGYIIGTLQYWEKSIPQNFWPYFKELKIIEVFSFLKGYLAAGGKIPFISNTQIPKIEYVEENITHTKYSIVIPLGFLSATIKSLLSHSIDTYTKNPKIHKIYCVYDEKIEHITKLNQDKKIEYLPVSEPGPAHARNKGIIKSLENGSTDVILADGDLSVNQNTLTNLIKYYERCNAEIACPILIAHGTSPLDKYHDINGTLNGRYIDNMKKELLYGTTSIMCINENIFLDGNYFSTDFKEAAGEDIDFCLNALLNGKCIKPIDQVKIAHWYGYTQNTKSNMEILISRFQRYGRGENQLLKKHPYYHKILIKSILRPSILF